MYVEIISVADKISKLNFRSLIFACQKTVDILRLYNNEIDKTFVKYLFMSIVAFSFRLKTNDGLYWNDKQNANTLGTREYPLYKFAYDYVKYQDLDIETIEKEEEAFLAHKKAEAVQNDAIYCLSVLYDFHSTKSVFLEQAIVEIKKHLEKANVIDVITYGKLANYLIIARDLIDTPSLIDDCKKIMQRNLQNEKYDGNKVSDRLSFHDRFKFWTVEQENEYNEFIGEMQSTVKTKRNSELNFDYSIENIDSFIKDILENRDNYINQRTFLKRMDISKLVEVIKQCTSQQVDKLRRAIGTVYSFSNVNEFFVDDKPSLIELKKGIEELLLSEDAGDKIKRLQLSWIVSNLDDILKK